MKKLLKTILALGLCLAIIFPAVAVSAGTSVKSQAQQPVKQFLKYAKALNQSKMGKYVADKSDLYDNFDLPSKYQKQLYSIIKKQNKKRFSYSITETTLSSDKKSAKIKFKVKYRTLRKAGTYVGSHLWEKEAVYYEDHGKDPSASQRAKWFMNYLSKGMKKYPAKSKTATITVSVKKYKSGWKISDFDHRLINCYLCDLEEGIYEGTD